MEKLDIRSLKVNAEPDKLYRVGAYGVGEFEYRKENVSRYFGAELKR